MYFIVKDGWVKISFKSKLKSRGTGLKAWNRWLRPRITQSSGETVFASSSKSSCGIVADVWIRPNLRSSVAATVLVRPQLAGQLSSGLRHW